MQSRVAAVVVNYHTGALLEQCLRRLLACPEVAELVLVDNGSEPGEIDRLVRELSDSRIQRLDLPTNPGFAVACNRGARLASAGWLLFLNPDCLVQGDTLTRLLEGTETCPQMAILGARLLDPQGHVEPASMRRDPLPRRAVVSALGLDRWPGWEGVAVPIPETALAPIPCDAVSGALMLVRREAFQALRGFDEGYFMHGEDLDLCRRMREIGYQVGCDPRVQVIHVKGVSSRRVPLRVLLAKHRALLRYFDKFDAPSLAWPWRWLLRAGAHARLLLALPGLLLPRRERRES